MLLEARKEILKLSEEKEKINKKIKKLTEFFNEEIFSKTWEWQGKKRHVQVIDFKNNKIQLGESHFRPWDNDDYTVTTFTLEEFINYYGLEK